MSDEFWYLKRCDLFSRLASAEIRRIEPHCRICKFESRSPIYLPSDEADGVLLLGQGRVKISSLTATGKETILTFIEPGELFGQVAIFDTDSREEYAESIEPSTVLLIPTREMRRLIREHPDVSLGVTKLIGLRLQHIQRRLANLMFLSNRERLIHVLLDLAERYGQPCDKGTELGIRISHYDLAKLIGCTRETVSITLGQLQNEGSVWRARQKIILTDIERLAKSVQVSLSGLEGNIDKPAHRTAR